MATSAATHRETVNPGLKARLSQSGLNYVAQVAVDKLSADLQNQHLDDQNGTDKVSGGRVEYGISNTYIRSFTQPNSKVTVTPGAGVTWSASGAAIHVQGDWRYKYRWHFVKGSDHGGFNVSASGVSFNMSVKLGVDGSGRPTIAAANCSSDIDGLKVKFNGGASWLYNIFDNQIARSLKGKLREALQKAVTKVIDEDARKKLANLNVYSNLSDIMSLDYSLVQLPIFADGFMETMHKGEVNSINNPMTFPFDPVPFPEEQDASRMVYFWCSDFVINTYAFTAFASDLLQYTLTQKEVPESEREVFNGPPTGQDMGSIQVDLKALEAPNVSTTPNGISLTFRGHMTLRGHTPISGIDYKFKSDVNLGTSVNVKIEDATIKATVNTFQTDFKMIELDIGGFSIAEDYVKRMLRIVSDSFIRDKLGELGKKGIKLPVIKGCSYANSVLQLNDGSLMVASDLILTPEE